MVSKNFEFLKDFYKFGQYYEEISKIEDCLFNDSKYDFIVLSSKFLERVLKDVMDFSAYNRPIGELVTEFQRFYKREKSEMIPSQIFAAFKTVSSTRNLELHDSKEVSYGEFGTSFIARISIMQNLRAILHFIIFSFNDANIKIPDFDDAVYYQNMNINKTIEDKNTFVYENNQIMLEKISIGEFVLNDKNNFVIPPYQREYRWAIEECQEMLNQLLNKYNTNELVYFGTMACKIEFDEKLNKKIWLIDGQQRITSSLLLFKVFNDIMKMEILKENDESLAIPIELERLFEFKALNSKEYSSERIKSKYLNYAQKNQEDLYYILTGYHLQGDFDAKMRFLNSRNAIIENYLFFKRELENFSIEKLHELYNYYSNNFVISCIKFDPEENDNEMEIFENLNARGKELDTFDMVKNFMYNIVDKKVFKERSNDIIKEFENYFRLNDIPTLKGNLDKQNEEYENFLFNFLRYKNSLKDVFSGKIQKNKKSILKVFKAFYNKKNLSFNEYSTICEELGRYFKIFKVMKINKEYENTSSEFFELAVILKNLVHKDFTMLLFRLIDIYSNYAWNKSEKRFYLDNIAELKQCLFEVEKWIICLIQVNGTGQSINDSVLLRFIKFTRLYDQLSGFKKRLPILVKEWFSKKIESNKENEGLLIPLENQLPTNKEIIDSLTDGNVRDKNIKLVLLTRLEDYWLNLGTKSNQKIIFKKPTIEHIIPKTLTENWKKYLSSIEEWTNEWDDLHRENVDKLGNLLILDGANNSELSNSSFEKKQESYWRTESRLAKISFNLQNENLLNVKFFGFKEVKDRSTKLATLIVEKIYEIK